MKRRFQILALAVPFIFSACASQPHLFETLPEEEESSAATVGERLFLETRFAQFFYKNFQNEFNIPLEAGDPVMEFTQTLNQPLQGAFIGESMNCAACHLVDQQLHRPGGGMRTYSDFTERSPIPAREDGRLFTPRNSPPLVNASIARNNATLFHLDGEFSTMVDLVKATLVGRNFGWMPNETDIAISHIASVIRNDDATNLLGLEFEGFTYRDLLEGVDPALPGDLKIPPSFRVLNVSAATDEEIFNAVAQLIAVYVEELAFVRDPITNEYYLSPYDLFLEKNGLPSLPDSGEKPQDYSRRLMERLAQLENPEFVEVGEMAFIFHQQDFVFGEKELEGMKIFFREATGPLTPEQVAQGGIGNCTACHAAPDFTDFGFHNTGASQDEYDNIHGSGTFSQLFIPDLAARNADPESYLPPSADYPNAVGPYLNAPTANDPTLADLGLWNTYANPKLPTPQSALSYLLCQETGQVDCAPEALLPKTIARFKTPGLRDLGHSHPYMHTGKMHTLKDVLMHYQKFSNLAREDKILNGAVELKNMALTDQDIEALEAFLNSLNEDYE